MLFKNALEIVANYNGAELQEFYNHHNIMLHKISQNVSIVHKISAYIIVLI